MLEIQRLTDGYNFTFSGFIMNGFSADDAAMLIETHRQELFGLLMRRVACPDTANDLLQDVFIRLVNCQPSEPVSNVRAFLYRMTDNIATDHLRKQRHSLEPLPDHDAEQALVDPTPLPDRILIGKQQLAACEQALYRISPVARRIFVMSRYQGYSHPRIAEELNVSVSWVEKNIMVALKALKRAAAQS